MTGINAADIRARRLALGLAQSDLAKAAAVRSTDLRKWERGLALPDKHAVTRLAHALGVKPADLLAAQDQHAKRATPGEGYTTAEPGTGDLFPRKSEPATNARRVLDIFCGSGGLSFGFEESGAFTTSGGIDLLSDRIQTFVANHPHATGLAGDIRACPLRDLRKAVGDIDTIVGGPPCQGFSSIRPFRTLTEGDPRNSLAEHYVLVIAHFKPRWFVFENVVGLLTHQNGTQLETVLGGLRSAGYTVDWRIMNAALYGVPQHRERIVIVGNRMGIPFLWPCPTHRATHKSMAGSRPEIIRTEPLFSTRLPSAVTLMEAIDDLPPVPSGSRASHYGASPRTTYQKLMRKDSDALTLHQATKHSPRMLEIIRHAGANISALPPGMVTSGFSSCYSRLDPDRPSTTLTVNFVHPASNRCIHPHQDRALTPREGARIQSFPDRFRFIGTSAQIVKQIGNAVPPLLGQRIAEAIIASEEAARRSPPARTHRTRSFGAASRNA